MNQSPELEKEEVLITEPMYLKALSRNNSYLMLQNKKYMK
jgi:hypothetical protein